MKLSLLFIPLLFCGCQIEKFNRPPTWGSTIITHERFFGLNASVPYAGNSIVKIQLGWGSHTWTVIPISTNKTYAPTISDTFSLGQSINPFSTAIKEDVQTGWESDKVPLPRLRFIEP